MNKTQTTAKEVPSPIPIYKRSIGISILLSFVTFGIYRIYWEYLLVKNIRALKKDDSKCTREMLCLILVPLYPLYWWFTRGKLVKEEFTKLGCSAAGSEITYLLLGLFGLEIVSLAIMQKDFNSLPPEVAEENRKSTESVPFFRKPAVQSIVASLICILGGLLVGFLVLLLMAVFTENIPISEAFKGILIVLSGPMAAGNSSDVLFTMGNMLFTSTPLIMTGLSVAVAFKTGLFNIGAPGQYLMGAMGSLLVALTIPQGSMPAWCIWTLALLIGTLLGVVWGSIPGFFKAKFNVNEVIVCILTNWIAANVVSWVFYARQQQYVNIAETKMNFIRKTISNGVSTATLGLDKLFAGSYLDVSIIIACVIAVLLYVMLNKTTFGYELRACGFNRNASKYAGMNEKRNIMLSMAIAGGLAACGAALWCLNGQQDFKWNTYQELPAVGFNGIPAALLASNNPIGVIFSAIFLRYIDTGGSYLQGKTPFNEYVPKLIVAVIIYFAGFSKLIKDYMSKKSKKKEIPTAPLPAQPAEEEKPAEPAEEATPEVPAEEQPAAETIPAELPEEAAAPGIEEENGKDGGEE